MSELNLVGCGLLPCLNCGKTINIEKDIHFCNANKKEWLNKQKEALIIFPTGEIYDLKNERIYKKK